MSVLNLSNSPKYSIVDLLNDHFVKTEINRYLCSVAGPSFNYYLEIESKLNADDLFKTKLYICRGKYRISFNAYYNGGFYLITLRVSIGKRNRGAHYMIFSPDNYCTNINYNSIDFSDWLDLEFYEEDLEIEKKVNDFCSGKDLVPRFEHVEKHGKQYVIPLIKGEDKVGYLNIFSNGKMEFIHPSQSSEVLWCL